MLLRKSQYVQVVSSPPSFVAFGCPVTSRALVSVLRHDRTRCVLLSRCTLDIVAAAVGLEPPGSPTAQERQ